MSSHIIRQCLISVCMFVSYCSMLAVHDHEHMLSANQFFNHVGKLHFVFSYFPVALVALTCVVECFNCFLPTIFINSASRFLIYSAALFAFPTILTVLILAYGLLYAHDVENIFLGYLLLGFCSMGLTIVAAVFRQKKWRSSYFTALIGASVGINGMAYYNGIVGF